MTFGEKLAKLRKENNYTQEQLADILEVSRQSVSKWESNIAYPETDKIIRMTELFDCSTDYLLKDECTCRNGENRKSSGEVISEVGGFLKRQIRERKSTKTVFGMPLYHIGRDARGFIAIGLKAKGIISIGLLSRGIFSLGLLSIGVISIGLLSLGLLSFGVLSVGALAVGSFALGIFAAGAISLGVLSFGAVSIGGISIGACAIGRYAASGDYANAMIAVGDTKAIGSVYSKIGELSSADISFIKEWLDANVPSYLGWAKEFFKLYIS